MAELDFIETAERTKEDYEEDPYQDEIVKDTKTPEESGDDSVADEDEEDDVITNAAEDRDFIPSFQSKRRHADTDYFVSGMRTRLRKRNQEVVVKQEKRAVIPFKLMDDEDTVMISDDEDYG